MTSAARIPSVVLIVGAACGRVLAPSESMALATAAAALAVVAAIRAVLRRRDGARLPLLVAASLLALAAGALRAASVRPAPLAVAEAPVAAVQAVVVAAPEPLGPPPADPRQRRGWGFVAESGDVRTRFTLDLPPDADPPDVLPGDAIVAVGRIRAAVPSGNPGAPRRSAHLAEVETSCVRVTEPGPRSAADAVRRAGERLRRALRERLVAACGGETPTAGLFVCILTGDRSGLPPEVARSFRDSGTAHLLAVSGLHLVLLAGLAAAAVRRALPESVRRRFGLAGLTALVVAYVAVCRFQTPVVRSAVFLLVAAGARVAQRRSSPLDHLALAASIVVSADPDQVADVGFQLSFAAVAGLTLLTRRFRGALFPGLTLLAKFPEAMSRRRLRLLRGFADGLSTSLAAQSATSPVVASTFGTAQPLGPLANLVAVPLFAAVLPFTIVLAVAGDAWPRLTRAAAEAVAGAFAGTADLAASAPLGHLALGRPPPWLLAAGIALLAAGARLPAWRRRDLAVPVAAWAVVALAPAALPRPAVAEAVALDVGHGLAVLVRSADGTALLYDAGGRAPALGDRVIVPSVRALGVRRLAWLVLSHEDADHCGAAESVVRDLDVGAVLVPDGFGVSPLAASVVQACRERGVPVVAMLAGDRAAAGGLAVEALHPQVRAASGAENEDSLVLRVEAAGAPPLAVLLTGDVEGRALETLSADARPAPARLLVLPHHGRGAAAPQVRLAARTGADVLVASASDPSTVALPEAWVTGAAGAVRVRAGRPPDVWPWDP